MQYSTVNSGYSSLLLPADNHTKQFGSSPYSLTAAYEFVDLSYILSIQEIQRGFGFRRTLCISKSFTKRTQKTHHKMGILLNHLLM